MLTDSVHKQLPEITDESHGFTQDNLSEVFKKIINKERYGLVTSHSQELNQVLDYLVHSLNQGVVQELLIEMFKWDTYTFQHALDVGVLGAMFAKQQFGTWQTFMKGCLLHDIGKVCIPRYVLQKPGKLTVDEYELIKLHTIEGERILKAHDDTKDISYLAKQHHERMDGSGYPLRLNGQALDKWVKALMIIDTYSAITLERAYQSPRTSEEALKIMLSSCHQLDRWCLQRFMEMLHIFPRGSIVQLSTGEFAQVIDVRKNEPSHPKIYNFQHKQYSYIPQDLSVRVIKFIDYSPK